ncbi:MAG TPA: hypothetical protein VGM30_10560 [Puia sp.]|jgi:hypothetical protein
MKPTASNINNNTSIVSSSNDVLWQGGDLPVINLCKGDSVSDVVQKAAAVLSSIKTELDLSDLDLQCIFDQCATCPNPSKTLHTVLTLLINKVCVLADLIGGPGTGTTAEPNVIIANCFRFTDSNGDVVTQLVHSAYTQAIGLQVCLILTTLNGQANTISNHESRITTLEGEIAPPPTLQVSVQCVAPGSSTANPIVKPIDTAFQLLEGQFCTLSTVLGDSTTLNQAVSAEPQPAANSTGVYSVSDSTQALWVTPAATVGQLLKHFDLAISDLRGAVQTILENCCKVTCDDIVVDFDSKLSDDRLSLTLFFITKSKIPTGYTDCNATFGNLLTITDALGNEAQAFVKIATEVNNPTGVVIDLSATAIDPSQDYALSMNACLTNGGTNCVKCITKSITYKDTCSYCEISVTGGHGISNGKIVVVYQDSTGATQYTSIAAGQTQVIKKSSTIKSIIVYGSATYTSTCGTLPTPEATNCYKLSWAFGETKNGADGSLESAVMKSISILGTVYPVNIAKDLSQYTTFFKTFPPAANGLINFSSIVSNGFDEHTDFKFYFQTTPTVAASIQAYLGMADGSPSVGFDNGAFVTPVQSDGSCTAQTTIL